MPAHKADIHVLGNEGATIRGLAAKSSGYAISI
jgi:hypothetical protein